MMTEGRWTGYTLEGVAAAVILFAVTYCGVIAQQPAHAETGCELAMVHQPLRETAIKVELAANQGEILYTYDVNGDGLPDLMVGYQVLPPTQQERPGIIEFMPNPVVYWFDLDRDGLWDKVILVDNGDTDNCRAGSLNTASAETPSP